MSETHETRSVAGVAKVASTEAAAGSEATVRFVARTSTRPAAAASETLPAVGLLAGWGSFPIVVAEAIRRQGHRLYVNAIRDHADPRLAEMCDELQWIGLAQLGRARRFWRKHGVQTATMAGKVHKIRLFQPGALWQMRPDWRTICRFSSHFLWQRSDRKDDTLLNAVVDEFALDGVRFVPATDFHPRLLAEAGQLTRRAPSASLRRDIEFGWKVAKELGRQDIGQCVVVKGQAIIAVEAIEGTDECIRRAGQLCRGGGFTVVKVAKPQQDMRFDVPTVGMGTLQTLVDAGAAVLAIEAQKTILLDREQLLDFADQRRLVMVSLGEAEAGGQRAAA